MGSDWIPLEYRVDTQTQELERYRQITSAIGMMGLGLLFLLPPLGLILIIVWFLRAR